MRRDPADIRTEWTKRDILALKVRVETGIEICRCEDRGR